MNNQIFYLFYNFAHQSVFVDKLIVFFAAYFPYIVIVVAIIFLLFHHDVVSSEHPFREFARKWKEVTIVFISSGVAWLVAKLIKIFIFTPRPPIALHDVHALVSETASAFPSGHATFFFGLAMALFFQHKKIGYWFMFFALLIGLARIAAGVHFPIDILGGFVLGALVAYLLRNV